MGQLVGKFMGLVGIFPTSLYVKRSPGRNQKNKQDSFRRLEGRRESRLRVDIAYEVWELMTVGRLRGNFISNRIEEDVASG